MRAIAASVLSTTFAALRCGACLLPLAAALGLPTVSRAQSSACDDFKRTLAERIEAGGVRGYSLETVPAGSPVPAGARAVGNCDGGAFTILYRRWGAARPAAAASAPASAAAERPARPEAAVVPAAKPAPTPAAPAVAASAVKPAAKPAALAAAASAPASAARAGARTKPAAPADAVPPPKPPADAAAVDRAVAQLAALPFTFDSPDEMAVGDRVRVRLTADDEAALAALQGAPGGGVVARRLSARLAGVGLRVTALSPELTSLAAADGGRWQWDVQPESTGTHTLLVTLDAEFLVDGAPQRRTVRSFERRAEVGPPLADRATAFAAAHWPWLLLALLLPLGGVAWAWHARRSAYDSAGLPRGPKIRF